MKTRLEAINNNTVRMTLPDGSYRDYWCPMGGGYVREIDDLHPGTLGHQVCAGLASMGSTLYCGDPDKFPLINLIRREYRRARRNAEQHGLTLNDWI